MENNGKKVLILGGTGFLGYHVIRAFSEDGFELGVMLHKRKDDLAIPYDGYKKFTGDIADSASMEKVINEFRPDVIIHLVGIMREKGNQTYENIHIKGTQNIVDAVNNAGIPDEKIIYVSALGADLKEDIEYYRTKAQAEEIIKSSGLTYTILRPAVMFGWKAQFTGRIVRFSKIFQSFPVITRKDLQFQIVSAQTTADIIRQAAEGRGDNNTYDITGPEVLTPYEITNRIKQKMGSAKPIITIPLFLVRIAAFLGSMGLPMPTTKAELKIFLKHNTGDISDLRKDFEFQDIYFDSMADNPLF